VTEQLLDLKRVINLVWRHRGLAALSVLVALIASIGLVLVSPRLYSASSLVLLPSSAAGNTQAVGNDMSTDSQIATSAAILAPVGRVIDPSLNLVALRQRVHAFGTATNVLQITALGSTPRQAEGFANSVATHLVDFVTTNGSATNASGLNALEAEAAQLTKQIDAVNAEVTSISKQIAGVGASSSEGQQDTALLASLTAQQSQSSLQLDSINSQIAGAQLGAGAANAGTEVIQKATTASPPSTAASIIKVGLGGLIGLALGSVLIVFLYRGDRRLRRRDAIAEAVGVPVLLSIGAPRRSTASEWAQYFDQYQASSNDKWRLRKVFRDLGLTERTPRSLVVLALSGDTASLVAGPQIALCAAALGIRASLNVFGDDNQAMNLRAAMERIGGPGHPSRPNLQLKGPPKSSQLSVMSMVVDPVRPQVRGPKGAVTLLAVSAGFATVEELARIAITAADSHHPIAGIVVTNPETNDFTIGRVLEPASPAVLPYRRPTTRPVGAKLTR
jgi:capsular polysaccharide biosynthesis protein